MTLRVKMIPVEEFFGNIAKLLKEQPSYEKLRRRMRSKDTIPKKWRIAYAKLVNAFGWNNGQTSKWASRTLPQSKPRPAGKLIRHDLLEEPEEEEEEVVHAFDDADAAPADEDELHGDQEGLDSDGHGVDLASLAGSAEASASPVGAGSDQDDLIRSISARLALFQHPRAKSKWCARYLKTGGWTQAFVAKNDLFAMIADEYPGAWSKLFVLQD